MSEVAGRGGVGVSSKLAEIGIIFQTQLPYSERDALVTHGRVWRRRRYTKSKRHVHCKYYTILLL